MKKIVDYHIYWGNDFMQLEKSVKDLIKEQWQPLGAPFYGLRQGLIYQAMVKYENHL